MFRNFGVSISSFKIIINLKVKIAKNQKSQTPRITISVWDLILWTIILFQRSHINYKSVFDITFEHSFIRFVDVLHFYDFNFRNILFAQIFKFKNKNLSNTSFFAFLFFKHHIFFNFYIRKLRISPFLTCY